jgi:ribosomal protein S27E
LSDYGRVTFRCAGCEKYGWRLLINKHAQIGINCMGCARTVIPASRCAAMIAERASATPGDYCGDGFSAGSTSGLAPAEGDTAGTDSASGCAEDPVEVA